MAVKEENIINFQKCFIFFELSGLLSKNSRFLSSLSLFIFFHFSIFSKFSGDVSTTNLVTWISPTFALPRNSVTSQSWSSWSWILMTTSCFFTLPASLCSAISWCWSLFLKEVSSSRFTCCWQNLHLLLLFL